MRARSDVHNPEAARASSPPAASLTKSSSSASPASSKSSQEPLGIRVRDFVLVLGFRTTPSGIFRSGSKYQQPAPKTNKFDSQLVTCPITCSDSWRTRLLFPRCSTSMLLLPPSRSTCCSVGGCSTRRSRRGPQKSRRTSRSWCTSLYWRSGSARVRNLAGGTTSSPHSRHTPQIEASSAADERRGRSTLAALGSSSSGADSNTCHTWQLADVTPNNHTSQEPRIGGRALFHGSSSPAESTSVCSSPSPCHATCTIRVRSSACSTMVASRSSPKQTARSTHPQPSLLISALS